MEPTVRCEETSVGSCSALKDVCHLLLRHSRPAGHPMARESCTHPQTWLYLPHPHPKLPLSSLCDACRGHNWETVPSHQLKNYQMQSGNPLETFHTSWGCLSVSSRHLPQHWRHQHAVRRGYIAAGFVRQKRSRLTALRRIRQGHLPSCVPPRAGLGRGWLGLRISPTKRLPHSRSRQLHAGTGWCTGEQ